MKKQMLVVIAMLLIAGFAQAQPDQNGRPPKPPTPEQRLKHVSEELNKQLTLTTAQKEKVLAAYKAFFADMEKNKSKDAKQQPPPPPPPPVSKEIADKLSAERDAKVKAALTPEQYKKYVEIEKTMRPKHPGKPGDDKGSRKPPTEE
jgi:Spy/CpxP family protein refolding chaperone